MEQKRTAADLVKKDPTHLSMQDLLAKLKAQYDKDEELDPNREMPKNTFKNPNMKNKLQELINQLVREELSLMEKKKKKDEEVDLDLDLDTPEGDADLNLSAEETPAVDMTAEPAADMDLSAGGSGDEKEIGKHLQAALESAKKLPAGETKDKLIRQIGNTALFFLKTQIPASGDQV
jgi:hypothetical protein